MGGGQPLAIDCPKGIKDICVSADGKNVIVLNSANEFQFADLGTGAFVGYIPPWNETPVTCFDFTNDGKRLLVGHEDGSLYIVDVDKVFVPEGEKAGVFEITDVDTGEKMLYDAENAVILGEDDIVIRKTAHNLVVTAAYKYSTSNYFTNGVDIGVGYINDRLINEIYFGGLVDFSFFPPNDNYPFLYGIGGTVLVKNPSMMGMGITLFVGKTWHPLNNEFEIFVEAQVNGALKFLTSQTNGTGDPNTTLAFGVMSGVRWEGMGIFVVASYDTIYTFNVGVGLSLKLRLTSKVKDFNIMKLKEGER